VRRIQFCTSRVQVRQNWLTVSAFQQSCAPHQRSACAPAGSSSPPDLADAGRVPPLLRVAQQLSMSAGRIQVRQNWLMLIAVHTLLCAAPALGTPCDARSHAHHAAGSRTRAGASVRRTVVVESNQRQQTLGHLEAAASHAELLRCMMRTPPARRRAREPCSAAAAAPGRGAGHAAGSAVLPQPLRRTWFSGGGGRAPRGTCGRQSRSPLLPGQAQLEDAEEQRQPADQGRVGLALDWRQRGGGKPGVQGLVRPAVLGKNKPHVQTSRMCKSLPAQQARGGAAGRTWPCTSRSAAGAGSAPGA